MIRIKTKEEIKILKQGGKILAEILDKVIKDAQIGAQTGDLEKKACELIKKAGGRPAFKNHPMSNGDPFPSTLCISRNNEIVHVPAIPSRVLEEGDIVGIDIGMEWPVPNKGKIKNKHSRLGGYYTDMSKTVAIGKVGAGEQKLIDTTRECLNLAIKKVKAGASLNEIGKTIQEHAEKNNFFVVRELVGHGVGHDVHEDPQVPNYEITDNSLKNIILKSGMVIAIEPMLNMGTWKIKVGEDGMSIITEDDSWSAHFEHTIAVLDDGCEVLTKL